MSFVKENFIQPIREKAKISLSLKKKKSPQTSCHKNEGSFLLIDSEIIKEVRRKKQFFVCNLSKVLERIP